MSADLPAVLGGTPVRPQLPPWPPTADWIAEQMQQLARDGSWGRYHGPHCPLLIDQLKEMHQVDHLTLCCSGSFGIELSLRSLRLPPGAEVILSAYDYKPNFTSVLQLGLQPVLVDIDPVTAQIDVNQLANAIGSKTGALLVSHLQGSLVDMRKVREVADAHELPVIEDACQMLGGVVQGRPAGTWGDVGVLSFGGSKLITSGRGGAVLTSHAEIAQRIKLIAHRGNDIYPLSEMQAALLLPQLERLSERRRCRIDTVEQLRCDPLVNRGLNRFGMLLESSQPDFYKLGFRYHPELWGGLSRDTFCNALRAEGIPFDSGFRSLHLIHAQRRFRAVGELPCATQADTDVVAVHHPFLAEPNARQELREALSRVHDYAVQLTTLKQT